MTSRAPVGAKGSMTIVLRPGLSRLVTSRRNYVGPLPIHPALGQNAVQLRAPIAQRLRLVVKEAHDGLAELACRRFRCASRTTRRTNDPNGQGLRLDD